MIFFIVLHYNYVPYSVYTWNPFYTEMRYLETPI